MLAVAMFSPCLGCTPARTLLPRRLMTRPAAHDSRSCRWSCPCCFCIFQVDPAGVIAQQDLFSVYVHTLPGCTYPNSEFVMGQGEICFECRPVARLHSCGDSRTAVRSALTASVVM